MKSTRELSTRIDIFEIDLNKKLISKITVLHVKIDRCEEIRHQNKLFRRYFLIIFADNPFILVGNSI